MVLVFGTICLDRIHVIPKFPKPGGYVEITFETEGLGGEAANTALAIRALGGEFRLEGNPIGDDEIGKTLMSMANELNLPLIQQRENFQSPVCDIYVTPDGERTMMGRGFSTLDKVSLPIPNFGGVDWVTVEPNMSNTSRRVVRAAKEAGKKTYLMDFFAENDGEIVRGCDFWQSSTDWVGKRGDKSHNAEWTNNHSKTHGCTTILSDGPNGFFVCERGKSSHFYPAFPNNEVVDGTGAGDVFRAGMLYGLDKDLELRDCLLTASAAACLACKSLGATKKLPTLQDVQTLISNFPEVTNQY